LQEFFSLEKSTPDRRSARADSRGHNRVSSLVRLKEKKNTKLRSNPVLVKNRFEILVKLEECNIEDDNADNNMNSNNAERECISAKGNNFFFHNLE